MFTRLGFIGAVALLLLAAALRLSDLGGLPPGLNDDEIVTIRITETIRQGRVEVFYDLGGIGRESLYPLGLAAATTLFGGGLIGYRVLSVFIALITLSLIYALGTRLYGTVAGLVAMGVMSVMFFPTLLARSITPEALLPLWVTLALLALVRSLPVYSNRCIERPQTASFAVLGITLGLGFYLHPINFALTLLCVLYIAYMVLLHRPLSRRTVSYTWFALVLLIVVSTPYLISSLQRPDLAGAARLFPGPSNATAWERFVSGLLGVFIRGDRSPLYNLPELPLIDLVSGLLLIIGVITALRYQRRTRFALLLLAPLFIAPFALLAANSPNFLAFAPVLPLIALLVGVGAQTLASSLPRRARLFVGVGLVALLGYHAVATTVRLHNVWRFQPAVETAYNARIGRIAAHLDRSAQAINTVVCAANVTPARGRTQLAPTQLLNLMLHQRNLPIRYADCGSALVLPNGGERAQIIRLDAEESPLNPYLTQWFARAQAVSQVGLPNATVMMLDVSDLLADRVGAFTTTAPITFAPEAPNGDRVALPPLRFDGNLTFLGYEHTWAESYRAGAVVPVTTYWRVDGVVPRDLRMFTHVLSDPAACCAAQNDALSVLPSSLLPRDVFIQVMFVQLPPTIRPGHYSISVGAYEDVSDLRLTVFTNDAPRGTRLFLGGFAVEG